MFPYDVQISGQNLDILPEWREKIEEELARLQKHHHDPILHARVELIGTGHHRLGAFEIHVVATVPGDTIAVKRQGEFMLPLIVEAFDVLDRCLKEHSRIELGRTKTHAEHFQVGRVARLFPDESYGFLETPDGLEVYFHANALKTGDFEKLHEGVEVKFHMEIGNKGPQAIWIRPLQ